jgi:hypothetical protein
MKVWIVRLTRTPILQWHEVSNTWEESWIAACYETVEQAEAASVVAAARNPQHLGKIRVASFEVAPSDMWLALMRKKRVGQT